MLHAIVAIVFWLVIVGLVYWAVSYIPAPEPFPVFIRIGFILIALLVVLAGLGIIGGGLPLPNMRG